MDSATVPTLGDLADAALRLLKRNGAPDDGAANGHGPGWRVAAAGAGAAAINISIAGPDIPETCNEEIAPPALIARERPWKGTYRLVVLAPSVVFDIYWTPGEPLRVMTFSRGDWERDLLGLSG